ncbi:MAG TPA: VOC family protein [Thermoplasmata archaeon]
MLASSRIIAFVATTDSRRAKEFYQGVLGLRLMGDEEFAIVLDAHGTMLRVSKVRELVPAPYTVLGWTVDDIGATARELTEKGVRFERFPGVPQDDHGIWRAPDGTKVAWFKDPDGNVLSLTEFPQ